MLWGGGSKGVSFLTTLGLTEEIAAAVDVNPYKQGKFMPGTAHPVIAPKALIDQPADLVIVMNPIYVPEIELSLKEMVSGRRSSRSDRWGSPDVNFRRLKISFYRWTLGASSAQ